MINQQEITEAPAANVAKELTLHILESLTHGQELRRVNVRLWDGSYWPNAHAKDATIVLNRPSALKEMLLAGTEAAMGEAYIHSAFDIDGNIEAAFEFGDIVIAQTEGWAKKLKIGYMLHQLPNRETGRYHNSNHSAHLSGQPHSLKRDREAIRFHYDVSNNFYRLWLDPWMVYSCAYFKNRDESLEAAQINKLDHICRKLDLKPGDRLLDIGCGWGGLLIHAATHFGIEGEGITLSEKQAELAKKRIYDAGLQDRVFVRIQDYRELEEWESYDAIVSVGMVEHVGKAKLPGYFQQAFRLLKPGGLFMNHGIGTGPMPLPDQCGSFIDQYRKIWPEVDTDQHRVGKIAMFMNRLHRCPADEARWQVIHSVGKQPHRKSCNEIAENLGENPGGTGRQDTNSAHGHQPARRLQGARAAHLFD